MILWLLACATLSNEDLRAPLAERDQDGDGVSLSDGDCDDTDAAVVPGGPEVPYDGRDGDCDPATPDDDLDGDGFLAADDCADDVPTAFPGAHEDCTDGLDTNCDGADDETDDACAGVGDGYLEVVLRAFDPRDTDVVCWGGPEGLDCRSTHVAAGGMDLAADIDGDAIPELVIAPVDGRATQVCPIDRYRLRCEEVHPGRASYPNDSDGAPGVGDVDGDGDVDLVLPPTQGGAEPMLLCLQDAGGWSCADAGTGVTNPYPVDLLDLDGDGDLDISSASPTVDDRAVCLNDGGRFDGCEVHTDGMWRFAFLDARDLDGDGVEELHTTGSSFSACYGEGLERLETCVEAIPTCGTPMFLDWDGQAGIDVVCDPPNAEPELCLHDGAGGYTCEKLLSDNELRHDASTLADLDDDGVPELVAASGTTLLLCSKTDTLRWDACTAYETGIAYYGFDFDLFDFGEPPR